MRIRILRAVGVMVWGLLAWCACAANPAHAGLTTNDLSTLTPTQLAQQIVGPNVSISNVQFTGATDAGGIFGGGAGIIGFPDGVILSTGNVASIPGPNTFTDTSTDNGMPGDSQLDTLIPGFSTFDASVLQFDFVPTTSTLTFQYVFASEEYNEYVDAGYNDVFGFFVNGTNVALIPNTNTPVSIDNVNLNTNSLYYRNNDFQDGTAPIDTEMDGLTTVLTATVNVNANQTNHIKFGIEDAGDGIYDSNVFIRSASVASVSNWTLVDDAVRADLNTLTLWRSSTGQACVRRVGTNGLVQGINTYGPYPNVIPLAIDYGPDGKTYLLWKKSNGQAILWRIGLTGQLETASSFGPYANTVPENISVGSDGKTRLLWRHSDGRATIYVIDNGTGANTASFTFGPYQNWSPVDLSVGPDLVTHILWTTTSGMAKITLMNQAGTLTAGWNYGPNVNWTALSLSVGADGDTRVFQNSITGRQAMWRINPSGTIIDSDKYGPYPNWTGVALSVGPDNITRAIISNTDGRGGIWVIDDTGTITQGWGFGPY